MVFESENYLIFNYYCRHLLRTPIKFNLLNDINQQKIKDSF